MGTTGKALSIAKFEFETHFQHYSLIVVSIKICRFKTFRVDVLHKEHSPPIYILKFVFCKDISV